MIDYSQSDFTQWQAERECHLAEIERLRKALERIAHAPCGRTYCADGHEEVVLIAKAALERK